MNKENVQQFFARARSNLTNTEKKAEMAVLQNRGNPLAECIAHNNKVAASNLNLIIDILEGASLNVIEQRHYLSKLINAYMSSEGERKIQMDELQKILQQQDSEMQELSRDRPVLEWIDEYLKHSSETSQE